MIDDHLGKWLLAKELGYGGMGKVYLAQEEVTGRKAALKVLNPQLAVEAGFLTRFQREIETLSQLSHPNIVRFYEAGCENGVYFYAMEYIDGESLETVLERDGRMPWKEVLDIAQQICPALKHAHDHGIIHRDLKPANILRTADGTVKLTDFGIAKVFAHGQLTTTGGVVGTAEYLSPEQAAGKPVTKRSDLYSLGAVLYTLLLGRPPFQGESFMDLLHKHRYSQFDPPRRFIPELPYEIDEVVCQLLEKDPAKRPPDCLVLAKQLDSIRRKMERKANPTRVGSGDAGTLAENKPSAVPSASAGPGAATLMSRLMREELERQNRGGPVAQLFNRWFVVLPLFLLVLGILVWTFWPASPETLFARGAALMDSNDPNDWERAWREYLEPLERDHPDNPHKAELDQFRKRLEDHRRRESGQAPSEGERLFAVGEQLWREGRTKDARQQWKNLIEVFQDVESEKPWVRKAKERVEAADKLLADPQRWAPVRAALKRAEALRDQGKRQEAQAIWDAIEALYQGDASAAAILQDVAAARKQ
jgi:serine/threonine-protein kinase